MLGGVAGTLAGKLAQALRANALGASRVGRRRARLGAAPPAAGAPCAGCACGLPRPGQHAQRRALLGAQQRVQRRSLVLGQAAGELPGNVALGQQPAATRRSSVLGPGATIRRRRSSSISAVATSGALVVARATGSSQRNSSRPSPGPNMRKPNASRSP